MKMCKTCMWVYHMVSRNPTAPCEDCKDYDKWQTTKQTNADRIRSMSDEKLAHFIDEFWSAPWCPDEPPIDSETKECMMHEGECELCILDWLKQEADDGEAESN